MDRRSGILLAISSLPSRHGIGSFGKGAFEFIDLLKDSGCSLWQILPLNSLGFGHSPYQPFSSFSIDEIYIDLDELSNEGILDKVPSFNDLSNKVNFDEVRKFKKEYLKMAFRNEFKKNPSCISSFKEENPWVLDYASFILLKKRNHYLCWNEWKDEDKNYVKSKPFFDASSLEKYNYEIYVQMKAYNQWKKVHEYASKKGIKIIGDIPFYVGYDSLDVYQNRNYFLLDEKFNPTVVAGVPPDFFSEDGQRWGNPIFNWENIKKDSYSFLLNRIVNNSKLYDIIRLDHFRAFDTYYEIPSSCLTAKEGRWLEAPGNEFLSKLKEYSNLELIAEDLGELRPEVYQLRDSFLLPGMNVLQFTFFDHEFNHNPEWEKTNQVAYLGTHDNQTIVGFYDSLNEEEKRKVREVFERENIVDMSISESFISYLFKQNANYAIVNMQDLLSLDNNARMNIPGVVNDVNWTWKLHSFSSFENKKSFLLKLNKENNRK